MHDYKVSDLQRMHKEETNPKAKIRLLIYIQRKRNMAIFEIAEMFNISFRTTQEWLLNAARRGIDARYNRKPTGVPAKLNKKQMDQLKADIAAGSHSCGFQSESWTSKMVVVHIKNRFGVEYAPTSIPRILNRLGFSYRKRTAGHSKTTDEPRLGQTTNQN